VIEVTNKVNIYYKKLYLIFFKSYKQEAYLSDAIEANNINSIEQNKNTLIKYTEEGLKKIEEITPFEEDKSLKEGCYQYLVYSLNHSKNTVPEMVDFILKKENMEKIQKAMESKKSSQRTNEDITSFNNAINEYNSSIKKQNGVINKLNKDRTKAINEWNNASSNFLDKHTPKYKNRK
jgi:predicted patatin/cPLA2 family phospholipase